MRELIRGRAGHERVFRMSYQAIGSLSKRLRAGGRTPPEGFCMKDLRSTCATYQSPLPGNAKAKADRLGHTLAVAEEHYLALPSGTPVTAPDLETVMQCEPELREIIARLRAARGAPLIGKATKATRSVRPGTMRSAAAAPQKKATRGKS